MQCQNIDRLQKYIKKNGMADTFEMVVEQEVKVAKQLRNSFESNIYSLWIWDFCVETKTWILGTAEHI